MLVIICFFKQKTAYEMRISDWSSDVCSGEAAMRGVLKPAGFGTMENIEPVWFDTTRWIGCIDGYGNTTAITKLMEGLDDRGAAVANSASYTALAAAIDTGVVAPGDRQSVV